MTRARVFVETKLARPGPDAPDERLPDLRRPETRDPGGIDKVPGQHSEMRALLVGLTLAAGFATAIPANEAIFDRSNLVAWCIVPFDSEKRSPEERAAMVAGLDLSKVAYDWRKEHVTEFEREILAYRKHGLEFFAFWGTHPEAWALFEKYEISPQIWMMLKPKGDTQEARVRSAAEALLPTLDRAKAIGSQVGLYNHGGWGGQPENLVAVAKYLRDEHGVDHVGIVYNLHHAHDQLDRLPEVLELMNPWLLCFNLNGMDSEGDQKGRKILPLGVGTDDVQVLRQLRDSGYSGPIGILNHTQEDAEARLLDNLDGLNWLLPQLDGAVPGEPPTYRSWTEPSE